MEKGECPQKCNVSSGEKVLLHSVHDVAFAVNRKRGLVTGVNQCVVVEESQSCISSVLLSWDIWVFWVTDISNIMST